MKKFVFVLLIGLCVCHAAADARETERIVEDLLGRRVLVPENPHRIIAMAPSITEIIFALKRERCLVGVTQYSDYPDAAVQYPKIGSYVNLDLEKIVSLRPDLCIAIKDGNPKDVIDRLASLKIPVFAVNPRNLDTVMQTIVEIGNLLNARATAKAIVTGMQERLGRVKNIVSDIESRPRVFFQIGLSPIVSVGSPTFIHELIVTAGGRNVAEGPTPYPRYSREQVVWMSPDVIIITSMARFAIFEQVKQEWAKWPDMPAAHNNRIYMQESNLFDRPTPRLIDGLELLVRLLHPSVFKETP
jgi:iron complex transport system substrate-binding protein